MPSAKVSVGLLIPSLESRKYVRRLAEETGLVSVDVEAAQHCTEPRDEVARLFAATRPEVILVDIDDPQAGIPSLEALQAALPETRLLALSEKTDPNLIMEAVRAGAREFLPMPIQKLRLSQAIDRHVAEKQRKLETRSEGKIYCLTAAKEGSGATSIAINIASVLAAVPGNRVALIELGTRLGDAALYLNLTPPFKTAEAFAAGSRLDSVLLDSCMTRADGLSVLPAPKDLGAKETVDVASMARLLKVAMQTYTYTIIDIPHLLPKEHLQVLAKTAEAVVVVANPELSSISRTGHLLRYLSTFGAASKLKLVINRCRAADDITTGQLEKVLGHPIYCKIPDKNKDSARALMSGKPLARRNGSALARSYHDLARQLAGIPKSESPRRFLSGRLFRNARQPGPSRAPSPQPVPPSAPATVSTPRYLPTRRRRSTRLVAPRFRVNLRHA